MCMFVVCVMDTCALLSSALKKETEMIDKGELDTELPGLWEKAQA